MPWTRFSKARPRSSCLVVFNGIYCPHAATPLPLLLKVLPEQTLSLSSALLTKHTGMSRPCTQDLGSQELTASPFRPLPLGTSSLPAGPPAGLLPESRRSNLADRQNDPGEMKEHQSCNLLSRAHLIRFFTVRKIKSCFQGLMHNISILKYSPAELYVQAGPLCWALAAFPELPQEVITPVLATPRSAAAPTLSAGLSCTTRPLRCPTSHLTREGKMRQLVQPAYANC